MTSGVRMFVRLTHPVALMVLVVFDKLGFIPFFLTPRVTGSYEVPRKQNMIILTTKLLFLPIFSFFSQSGFSFFYNLTFSF